MRYTKIAVRRGTGPIDSQTPIAENVRVQIDSANLGEEQFDGGASPYNWYSIFVMAGSPNVDIRQNDHLVAADTEEIFTVFNIPEKFPDRHQEIVAFVPRSAGR
jgi:hypothetical protein